MALVLVDRRIQKWFPSIGSLSQIVLKGELHQIVVSTDRKVSVRFNKISQRPFVLSERAFRSSWLDEIPKILVKKKLDRIFLFDQFFFGLFTSSFCQAFLVTDC